ncbi:hypothetical protein ACFFUT_04795 [Pseudohalocynthiibacter aestuariivivens]|uniref:Uncharacterized protein n=1 Tax=Pseudohalocynthiibacter aestuariivivens TaxID=1591409 RepID=A0ABV5JCD1_9RHOB|nr:hypothetical protein [Pseudohalocynthiibacter aestuariivivens]MBS9718546.1 hypothetical protein [Pseudohalocynthiibacter aestuariivivens]
MKTFRVTARSKASSIFRSDDKLEVHSELDGRLVRYMFITRYVKNFTVPHPGDMMVFAQGDAPNCMEAAQSFLMHGQVLIAIIACVANAHASILEPEISFEVEPESDRGEYFQRFMRADKPALTSRFINVEAASKAITAVHASDEQDRIIRATAQYAQALRNWRHGFELIALSHLFMGVEAIQKACLRHKLKKDGKTSEELAADWGWVEGGGNMTIQQYLDAAAKGELVFQSDRDTYNAAKDVSDRYEHGLENMGTLIPRARDNLVLTAKYLREAIFSVLDLDQDTLEKIMGEPYNKPRGPLGQELYLSGELTGVSENYPPDGFDWPSLFWKNGIKDITFDEHVDKYKYHPDMTVTGNFKGDAKLENLRFEIWDASSFWPAKKDTEE